MAMNVSQLLNIDSLLVTAANPARVDVQLGMEYERCAGLHNYLVQHAWMSEGRELADLPGSNTFFTTHGAEPEALRPRLHPSVASFLDTSILPPVDGEPAPLFFWVNGLSEPDFLFADHPTDMYDQPEDSLLSLYFPNIGQGGEFGGGLLYHQGIHRAAMFMHMDDYGYALPVEEHLELWHPLETVLSNWIELIRLGKVVASSRDEPALFGVEKIGSWEWRPYGEGQVDTCVSAWDRLCNTIEARISPLQPLVCAADPEPLLTPSALATASIPKPSFAHAFLSRARRPRFRFIAPSLLLPPTDASEFAASQPFTQLPRGPQAIPPVLLFPAATSELADLTGYLSPFCDDFCSRSADGAPSRAHAGVYSESVESDKYDITEEGFRLLLPYNLKGGSGDDEIGARKSDGSFITPGTATELFQHGYKPFGGDYYRPQRLERLFDHWRKMVEDGVWSVGPEGVEGTIDTFKQADSAAHWRDYIIAPTW
ncbi:hypothetical protein F5Y02DRAFT_248348 [Annulohypoxylon stygium]|nr:hypothetical protein F5Y02DRAFT_248348 [Annulohypoxylon stygium]